MRASGSPSHPAGGDVDLETGLAEERARALGRAGRRLQEAVAAYRAEGGASGLAAADEQALLDRVTARLYALVVQRECAGARHANLEGICAAYDVPEAARRRM